MAIHILLDGSKTDFSDVSPDRYRGDWFVVPTYLGDDSLIDSHDTLRSALMAALHAKGDADLLITTRSPVEPQPAANQ